MAGAIALVQTTFIHEDVHAAVAAIGCAAKISPTIMKSIRSTGDIEFWLTPQEALGHNLVTEIKRLPPFRPDDYHIKRREKFTSEWVERLDANVKSIGREVRKVMRSIKRPNDQSRHDAAQTDPELNTIAGEILASVPAKHRARLIPHLKNEVERVHAFRQALAAELVPACFIGLPRYYFPSSLHTII